MERLGERIQTQRQSLGLSVAELAKRACVSVSYVYAIEAGHRGSQIRKLAQLARALDLAPAELWPDV